MLRQRLLIHSDQVASSVPHLPVPLVSIDFTAVVVVRSALAALCLLAPETECERHALAAGSRRMPQILCAGRDERLRGHLPFSGIRPEFWVVHWRDYRQKTVFPDEFCQFAHAFPMIDQLLVMYWFSDDKAY